MNFLYPNFLWALLFIAVPIIIHLFYFRRYKKIYFSNTTLLNEVKDERSSRNKLKHLLVLFSRILAIIFLVLAFAQPFFKDKNKQKRLSNVVSIYIDNSFSMNADGKGQSLFDEAKTIANEVVNSYATTDLNTKFQILTNDFEGKHQRLVNNVEAKSFIKDLKISASIKNNKTVFNRQKTIFKNNNTKKIVFEISDFQKNTKLLQNDTAFEINIVKLNPIELKNIYIDSLWFENSYQLKNASNQMIVRFKNESNENVNGNYQFVLNEKVKSVGEYRIKANSTSFDTIDLKITETGWNTGKVQISDYPVIFDDTYFYSFFVEDKVNVLKIFSDKDASTNYINSVFKAINNIAYNESELRSINYNDLTKHHCIILDELESIPSGLTQSLKKHTKQGGSLFIIPNKQMSVSSYNTLLSTLEIGQFSILNQESRTVSKLNMKHFVINDLFEAKPRKIKLPQVKKYYSIQTKINSNEEQIMSFKNNDAYLSSFVYESGKVFVLMSSLRKSMSDISSNALFAPIVYKIALVGVNTNKLSFEINSNTKITLQKVPKNFEDVISVKNDEIELIPQKNLYGGTLNLSLLNTKLKSGIYDVVSKQSLFNSKIALNYSRKESVLEYYSLLEMKALFPENNVSIFSGNINSINQKIIENSKNNFLWKWFILFSLIFIAIEILLLKFLRN